MATKNAAKTSKRAEVNIPAILNSKNNNQKTKKSQTKKTANSIKKLSGKAIAVAILCVFIGIALGIGTWYVLCKDDCFDLIGQDELSFTLDETYTDQGVKIVAFGKDDSTNVTIQTNLKQNSFGELYAEEAGTYYIIYKTTNFKYSKLFKVQKIRLITFEEASEGMNRETEDGINE